VKQCFGAIVHESYHKRPVYFEMPRRMAGHLAGQNAFPGEVPLPDCSWITGQPEVILGAFGEFETCPDWVPSMDDMLVCMHKLNLFN